MFQIEVQKFQAEILKFQAEFLTFHHVELVYTLPPVYAVSS